VETRFRTEIRPFLETYCLGCHSGEKPKGDLDLSAFTSAESVAKDLKRWETVLEQLEAGSMPPAKAKQKPTADARDGVITWIGAMRKVEAARNSGDPGRVPARRLSNAEYDHTIRDLTGVDLRPTKEFPVDPANEAGFDNSAESLAMSTALVKKYLKAARLVADHLVLKPDGLAFAPHSMLADTDRDKYCVRAIIDFYKRQNTDYADYFLAAWRFKHRSAFGRSEATLNEFADERGLSRKYLATIWGALNEELEEVGPIAAVQALWRELPEPNGEAAKVDATSFRGVKGNNARTSFRGAKGDDGQTSFRGAKGDNEGTRRRATKGDIGTISLDAAREGCERMRDVVVSLRRQLVPEVKNMTARGIGNGTQPFVLWKNRQMAANRMRYAGGTSRLKTGELHLSGAAAQALDLSEAPADIEQFEAGLNRFCRTFPDAFVVSERARVFLEKEDKGNTGRLLSAGFHSMTGYFRDDGPLYELILDDAGRRDLDCLWREFDFITGAPMRQYSSYLWFERAETGFLKGDEAFDFVRAEDKDAASEPKMGRFMAAYLAKARRMGASDAAQRAIEDQFHIIAAAIRGVEKDRVEAEPRHLESLQQFAERAYRRPLLVVERQGVADFYHILRDKDGLAHEDAVRDTVVSILMSPHFCYRVDRPSAGTGVRPLSDYDLASRLSYFLWASMPDAALLACAAAGELHEPDTLVAQAQRMLRDDRVRGLATEFGGNWLDFRRFEEHNSVDRARFPAFDDELRRSMFEEPILFFYDLVRNDRPVTEFLYGKHTFVNGALARHYGMPFTGDRPEEWVRVDDATRFGRGGLLPMAVFLTKNSPGLRTSPVKRGYWVVRRVLGENIPPPPAIVPELPDDESKLGELRLRDVLARHRADKACAGCHERFDVLGLAFEGYGPIGEARTVDLGGRPIDARATFPRGGEGEGIEGLRDYIKARRGEEFVDNLCRKLLAYALGRTLIPSDDETIAAMHKRLEGNGGRFSALVGTIVTSPQFRNKRIERANAE
jgi:hypothetical protein